MGSAQVIPPFFPALVRVLICDDRMVVREGLKYTLSQIDGVTVIDEADNGTDCVRMAQRLRPDVVLLDIALIGRDGLDTLAELKCVIPSQPVLMLADRVEPLQAARCLQLGAAGLLAKRSDVEEWATALRTAAAGRQHIPAALARAVAAALPRRDPPSFPGATR